MKPKIEDLDQCESCEGFFDPEKMENNGEQSFCKHCDEGITNEIIDTGVENLDEYLNSRNLHRDFWIFAHSKWSGVTEEEFKELHPED